MAHGINESSKRNRVKNGAKGWVKPYKQKLYLTDKEAIKRDIEANGGLDFVVSEQIHYIEYAAAYNNGEYDNKIYGYNRKDNVPNLKSSRRRINSATISKMVA